jgi:tRNA pseudouridine38-40 synthase
MRRLEVSRDGELLFIDVEATAFLKHMVRVIVGTLVEVGRGKHPPDWVAEVLASRDRTRAGPTAPACGLCLERVFYPD